MNLVALNSSKKWGGNERWLRTAMNCLAENGHFISLVVRSNVSHWNNLHPSINIIEAPYTNELSIKTKSIIRKIIKENDIDIMLSTKRKDYILGAQIKNRANVFHVMRLGISRPILKRDFIQRYIISNQVDGIIVNALALKNELLSYGFINNNFDSDKIACIYNGYSIEKPINTVEIKKDASLLIRSAGRLTVHKGYDLLINSLSEVEKLGIDYKVEIAGEGPELNELNNLIKKYGLQHRCKLVGEKNDIITFFSRADLVIIPSRSEGIPNTLFEAWMSKRPVIATNAGGVSEVIDHGINGLICEPDSNQIFSTLADYVENNRNYKDMGEKGYNKLIKSFSMENMTNKLETYLHSFIE